MVFTCTQRIAILIALVLIADGCRSQPKPQTNSPAIGWRPVGSWSGNGNAQTDSFNIETGQFRVKWKAGNETIAGAGTFKVMANSAVSGRPIAPVVEQRGTGKGIGYVTDDPRLYYLAIESSAVDWTVTVEEGVSAAVP